MKDRFEDMLANIFMIVVFALMISGVIQIISSFIK